MTHLSYDAIVSESTDIPTITVEEDTDASVSGVSVSNVITVQAPFDTIFFYTTDGTEPTTGSYLYTGPIEISGTTSGEVLSARILAQHIRTLETSEMTVITASF